MTDNITSLHLEAKGATLSAIAAASTRAVTLLDEGRLVEIVQIAEGLEDLCCSYRSLCEAERELAEAE